uniref:NADH-ubiquinone oxidoreductase chain 4L n=1 Tax=Zaptyx kotoshoensis TaxID=1885890 RepID=A0A224ACH5_9EUPU|nr:NADH dehydrogenase subunit 4L [Zaptyx kotoshoensis]
MIKVNYLMLLMLLLLYFSFFNVTKHYISSLMILESMVLVLILISLSMVLTLSEGLAIYMWVLTLSVCEAAMGLSLLMSLLKVNSNDYVNSNMFS